MLFAIFDQLLLLLLFSTQLQADLHLSLHFRPSSEGTKGAACLLFIRKPFYLVH